MGRIHLFDTWDQHSLKKVFFQGLHGMGLTDNSLFVDACLCVIRWWQNNIDPLKVFEGTWYAGMYGSGTEKPHVGWSNSRTIACLNKGKMNKTIRAKIKRRGVKSTKTYKNRWGKKRFSGSKALKSTGIPGLCLQHGFAMVGCLFNSIFFKYIGSIFIVVMIIFS
jgi:hypothetical protein